MLVIAFLISQEILYLLKINSTVDRKILISNPGLQAQISPALQADSLPSEPSGKSKISSTVDRKILMAFSKFVYWFSTLYGDLLIR